MLKLLIAPIVVIIFIAIKADASSCHGSNNGGSDYSTQHEAKQVDQQRGKVDVQTLCPVMEKSIGHTIYADWKGDEKNTPKRIYLCCEECKAKFNKRPAKYVLKLRKMGQYVENNFTIGQ